MAKKTRDNTNVPVAPDMLVDAWVRHLINDDRSANTVRSYRSAIQYFLAWYLSEEQQPLTLDDLTPIALIGYRNYLQHHQTKTTSTVNTRVAALRTWCTWLNEQGYLPTNPAARLKTVGRPAPHAPKGLTDPQINALLREAQRTRHPQRDYALVQMMLQTGMRVGECAALTINDVVFGERSGSAIIRSGKGNTARTVPLNGSARQALAEYMAPVLGVETSLKAVADRWPRRAESMPTPVWRSQKHQRLSAAAIRRMIDHLVHACATRRLVPETTSAHTLRHTFAMHYLKSNPGDVIGLATLLGHRSLDTTRMYGQPTAEQLANRVDRRPLNA